MAGSISGVLLVDAPILCLVHFHNALRAEFAELRRIAVEASENTTHSREFILDLRRRFEFLKLFYKYHSATEDEVIFLALDVHVKNVVCTYSLEHKSIDDLFDSVFHFLNILTKEDEDISKPFQELVYCIGSIQTTICQHMLKEEEQVFPLLMQQFSSREQASLVWQFLCSIPIMLLEVFFPWMSSFLSPHERLEFMNCIKDVVPEEKLLQEVVISWLDNKEKISLGAKYGEGAQVLNGLANFEDILKLYTDEGHSGEEQQMIKEYSIHVTGGHNPIDGIHLWHGAIRKDLKEILEELCQIRRSNSFATLASVVVQLKFFADVLIFYSNALDKIFHPLWHELAKDCPSPSYKQFLDDGQIQSLQKLLYYKDQTVIPLSNFVEKLCGELESFVRMINEHLTFLETDVFAFISMNCSHQMQKWVLYTSLQMMPLGLLKCMITWFSAQLSEDESKSIMYSVNQEGPLASKPLASLICEWVRIGYSGKTSVEKFRKDLHEVFNSRCPFPPEQIKEDSLHINSRSLEAKSFTKAKNQISTSSSSGSNSTKWHDTLYNSGINMHVYFPQTLKISSPLPSFPADDTGLGSVFNLELRPMDHILFFHKALKKDLEYLVFASAKLVENIGLFMDFHRRFHLVRFLYQIHSDSEDDVAFPALEAKGKLQNISHSYTIDHKMEVEHFSRISIILDEISGLHVLVSSGDVDALGQRRLKYRQLCVKLHDMCISMRKIVCDHINHEEIELWPLFGEHFSIIEQEKIIGRMLGRVRAEILQEMIPWLMASLTIEQQNAMMSLWRRATKNTMFDEWLREWWKGMTWHDKVEVEEESAVPLSCIADPLEVISTYLLKEGFDEQGGTLGDKGAEPLQSDFYANETKKSGTPNEDAREKVIDKDQYNHQMFSSEVEKKNFNEVTDVIDQPDDLETSKHHDHFLIMTQEELEAAIRRVNRDSTLDPRKKSHITQNMIMSRWSATQQKSHPKEVNVLSNKEEIIGQCFSYRDPLKLTYGCKHYKRNCKLVSSCCNKLYTCRYCHDDAEEHLMDRKATTKMMCMKCLIIQPIGPTCSTASCNGLSMARYYCRICKFFDDEREIYHCPYCNLCRVGKGLGIDYFHCMNCNACMSRYLSVHICREKGFEDFCPICHEFIFTSSSPIKALPCGHMMHSACFQDYTCTHYICPICSKSLGDMQVYFGMIDALLAEEKIPDEYAGQTQDILCNDCEKRGIASFHWLYHKCADCGSYNTRLL